jgi:hypothetical protein
MSSPSRQKPESGRGAAVDYKYLHSGGFRKPPDPEAHAKAAMAMREFDQGRATSKMAAARAAGVNRRLLSSKEVSRLPLTVCLERPDLITCICAGGAERQTAQRCCGDQDHQDGVL